VGGEDVQPPAGIGMAGDGQPVGRQDTLADPDRIEGGDVPAAQHPTQPPRQFRGDRAAGLRRAARVESVKLTV
jgi:hypothetical protein